MRGLTAFVIGSLLATGCVGIRTPFSSGLPPVEPEGPAGWSFRSFRAPVGEVQAAASDAMEKLGYGEIQVSEVGAQGSAIRLEARRPEGGEAVLTLNSEGSGTNLSLHVSPETQSESAAGKALLAEIGRGLGETGAAAPRFSKEGVPDSVMLPDQSGSVYRDSPIP